MILIDLFPETMWWCERLVGETGSVVPDLSDWPALDEVIECYRLEAHHDE